MHMHLRASPPLYLYRQQSEILKIITRRERKSDGFRQKQLNERQRERRYRHATRDDGGGLCVDKVPIQLFVFKLYLFAFTNCIKMKQAMCL